MPNLINIRGYTGLDLLHKAGAFMKYFMLIPVNYERYIYRNNHDYGSEFPGSKKRAKIFPIKTIEKNKQ
jgi:hypothetical protein